MKLNGVTHGGVSISVAYDPIDVRQFVRLDDLRRSEDWPFVVSMAPQTVVLAAQDAGRSVTIGTVRFQYTDENERPFTERDLTALHRTISSLPELSTKAIVVVLQVEADLAEVESAAAFITDTFLKDKQKLAGKLGGAVLSTSIWIDYGTTPDYTDIRLTPLGLEGPKLNVHFRYRKQVSMKHPERLNAEIDTVYSAATQALDKALQAIG